MSRAFSLIELMIVIVIIGVIYTISVGSLKKIGSTSEIKLNLENLNENLLKINYNENIELLCLDDCKICKILVDDIVFKSIDTFLDRSVLTYNYNFYSGLEMKNQKIYFDSEGITQDVCFSYMLDAQGVGDQIIVEYKDKAYDFTSYLQPTLIYNSLEDALEKKENLIQEILR
ncbi:MAG: prepilin-type N-terminal cleavage/methylation domain-containing protein [Sulfurospirillum sp.]|nr:prepilin-type N-terminal cleavage/methylation domain-containing protein [Sulfurospirillum sp.]MBL0703809.1 prepilin-type N-terminal cleavage/methylation domain-containing protein [Sulfurospirillum sp.]